MSQRWITESASVLSQEDDVLWVAAERASACASCKAKKGCGTSLLAKVGAEQVVVRAIISEELRGESFQEGELVELAVDRLALVRVSLIMYLLPLAGMIAGVLVAMGSGDAWVALAAALGLFFAATVSRVILQNGRDSDRLQPLVLRKTLPASVSEISVPE